MLGKLIKYDLKSMNRFLIILHAFLLLIAVLLRVFVTSRIQLQTDEGSLLFAFAILAYVLAITGIAFGTAIVIAVRFYKNLFSDEGYLTWTLPVTPGTHLLAKTISGSIWSFIDNVLVFAALYIGIATPDFLRLFESQKEELMTELGFVGKYADITAGQLLAFFLLMGLLSCICNVVIYYASIVLGQLFPSHRVVGAVACYFAITTLGSVASFLFTGIAQLSSGNLNFRFIVNFGAEGAAGTGMSLTFVEYISQVLVISLGASLLFSAVLYIISYQLMKKKIDLN